MKKLTEGCSHGGDTMDRMNFRSPNDHWLHSQCYVFFFAFLSILPLSFADDPTFRAGAYAIDVTPQHYPVPMVGSMTPKFAHSAHDPLHARCQVLDDGETQIAFVIVDSCLIPRDVWDAAKARIGYAVGNNPQQVYNRRWYMASDYKLDDPLGHGKDQVRMNPPAGESVLVKPAGPIDPEVSVLAVQSLDGAPLALLTNYSLHYVGGLPPETLSADYFGEFAKQVGHLVGADEASEFVGIMTNGTSGDINNINFFEPRDRKPPFEQIQLVAATVTQSAKLAYDRIDFQDWMPLEMVEEEIELGVRKPTEAEAKKARERLASAGEGPYTDRVLIYANESVKLLDYPDTVKVKLQALRRGDLGIAATPTETFVETGLAIKKISPLKPTFVIELANGYNGYIPTVEQHTLGGYETWRARSSYLAVNAEPKVRRTLLNLLREISDQ